ncbi:MAG: glycerate kinase type-2 family protein [Lacipirellulaceae bacterium]
MDRSLSADALAIWRAGVDAVRPETLLPAALRYEDGWLVAEGTTGETVEASLDSIRRVWVVGGGKGGAGMARGFERAIAGSAVAPKFGGGLLSVPTDCVDAKVDDSVGVARIRLVAGRPAGVNEPRSEGEQAARAMLRVVADAHPDDLVVCLLSGGGSALLPAPTAPVTLADKVAVARRLAAAGATIDELNTVRQHLSDFKGGGLARACRARRLWTLVVSDVLGDPLELIASGPTLAPRTRPADALDVLVRLGLASDPELARCVGLLCAPSQRPPIQIENPVVLLANNAAAVDAAGVMAERLGYSHAMTSARSSEGPAEDVGRQLAALAASMRAGVSGPAGPDCLISGGEPTVTLAPEGVRGVGGRNQQLALAALGSLDDWRRISLVSGGTDGEDGPTDAAGAVVDEGVARRAAEQGLDIDRYLGRNDAYAFFAAAGGLLKTGPTHTNVCDLRVVSVAR